MATESNLKEARLNIAQSVLNQLVGVSFDTFYEEYKNRDESYANLGPAEYAAKVAVRYADALINELYYND